MSRHKPETVIIADPDASIGVAMDPQLAIRRFGEGLPAVLAVQTAFFYPKAIVHFWDEEGQQRYVAHETTGLSGRPLEDFEKQSFPVTRWHPDRPGICGSPDGAPPEKRTYRLTFSKQFVLHGDITVEAVDDDDAERIVRENFDEHQGELHDSMSEYFSNFAENELDVSMHDLDEIEDVSDYY